LWTQVIVLARPVLYQLSHAPIFVCFLDFDKGESRSDCPKCCIVSKLIVFRMMCTHAGRQPKTLVLWTFTAFWSCYRESPAVLSRVSTGAHER
jgi:hypothetical protein